MAEWPLSVQNDVDHCSKLRYLQAHIMYITMLVEFRLHINVGQQHGSDHSICLISCLMVYCSNSAVTF